MPWEDPDDQKPGEPEKPLETPELWSHVPNLESFLQELYTRSTGLSTEPTSAQFSALSARVNANSAAGASVDLTSVYNAISIVSVAANRDPIKLSVGNTSTPGYTFSADPKTGMFLVSVSRLGFTVSGVDTLDLLPNQFIIFGDVLMQDGTYDIGTAGSGRPRQIYATLRIKNANGTMVLPSYTFENDISTGMGLIAPNILGFATEGVERLRLTSAGATFAGTISSPTIDALSTAISVVSNAVSAVSQALSSQAAALSVRIDTQSQGISVLSNQVSVLSNLHSALSNAVSVISQQVSALSQSLSSQAASLSVRIDTQSQGISVLSNQVSALSQAVSIISVQVVSALSIANAASAAAAAVSADLTSVRNLLSNAISILSQQVSVISQAVSVLSQAHSTLSAAHVSLVDRVSANSALAGGGISIVPTPGGRLTLTSATPVLTTAVLAAVKIFYTPYVGNALPIFDGTNWQLSTFSELEMSLDASVHVSSTLYDVFVVNDAGTRRIVTGPAWATSTTRGTGVNTTELQLKNGIWTNKNLISAMRYGSLAVSSVSANMATYLGTFRTTDVAGQTEQSFGSDAASGIAANILLWNNYNRVFTVAKVHDNTNSWTYAGAGAFRAVNGSNSNRINIVRGLDEDSVLVITSNVSNATVDVSGGVGLDSTTVNSGINTGPSTTVFLANTAIYIGFPGLGFHFLQRLEQSTGGTATFYGDSGVTWLTSGFLGYIPI